MDGVNPVTFAAEGFAGIEADAIGVAVVLPAEAAAGAWLAARIEEGRRSRASVEK